ncbi:MAG: dihydrodipicolinate reductase [Marmoricola sp.]|nr:dihydrodipicolinate reductase [Marmoricola sp.]
MKNNERARVFQVATGNVGSEMIKRLQVHPDLNLIGVHCYSADKVGRDAGELAGIGSIGIRATGTVDEIIAARPDCVTFHGVWPDIDLYEKVLEAGINVVTTADFITGHHRDSNHPAREGRSESQIIAAACERGSSTFYGTGMNPGMAQVLTVVNSANIVEIENVICIESVDVSCHHSVDTWRNCGFGMPVDDPETVRRLELGTRVFEDGVRLMADCLDVEIDEVAFEYDLGACTKEIDLGWYVLPENSLGGCYLKYVGKKDGVAKVELHCEWQMTPLTQPNWNIKGGYVTRIQGDPCVYSKQRILPKPGTDFTNASQLASMGMSVTGMPALNAIKAVVAARPGIITSKDLPLSAFAGRFAV